MGPNNSGKSSAISAINLLAQTSQHAATDKGTLVLNGAYDELGTYIDLVHGNHAASPLGIDFGYQRNDVSLEFKYRSQRREIELRKFDLSIMGNHTFSYTKTKDSFDARLPGRGGFELAKKDMFRPIQFNGFWPYLPYRPFRGRGELSEAEISRQEKIDKAMRLLSQSSFRYRDLFSSFDSLGPFRERPKRTYTYSGEIADRVGRSGGNGILLLANSFSSRTKASKEIIEQINDFLSISGIAQSITVKSLTRRHYEVCVVGHDGKEHNICDVGFGCSQVLPVLMAGLNLRREGVNASLPRRKSSSPIFVVQEPEIHLHPNAQASLGSFFTGLARSRIQTFVETHSDHLVLRVARHIARGDLNPDDVKIFFVEPSSEGPRIHRMAFDEKGKFKPHWPGEFMPHRKSEALLLARDRMASHSSDTSDSQQLIFDYL